MSTTARKARKRAGIRFERTPKTGTPVAARSINQSRGIYGKGLKLVPSRYGLTSAAAARIAAYLGR